MRVFGAGRAVVRARQAAMPQRASHGCRRVPMADAVTIYGFIRVGDPIDVCG